LETIDGKKREVQASEMSEHTLVDQEKLSKRVLHDNVQAFSIVYL